MEIYWRCLLLAAIFTTIIEGADDDPCEKYHVMDMYEGQRHVNFTPPDPSLHDPLCDRHRFGTDFWYRFVHDGVNYELANKCVPLYSCGTVFPIWMVGNYPSIAGVTTENHLCSNYEHLAGGECTCHTDWADGSKKVDVRLCEDGHGGDFYIHRFDAVPGCQASFCIQDHPAGTNVHEGDTLKCDEKDGECTSITIVLNTTVSSLSTSSVFCNFVPDDKKTQNHIQEATWKTTTTVQCDLPTDSVSGVPRRLFGLYKVHVVQTFDNKESKTRKTAQALVFDSTCQTCDFTTNRCNLKDNMCFVNGQCCQGSQCDLCETPPQPTDTTSVIDSTTTATASTISKDTTAETSLPILWIVVPILVVIIAIAICVMLGCIYRSKMKPRQIDSQPPPYTEGPYAITNPAYGDSMYPANGIVASGGSLGEPVKAALEERNQNSVNETQYMNGKLRQRANEAFENERSDSEYYEIPQDHDILPPIVGGRGQLYENHAEEKQYEYLAKPLSKQDPEHTYSTMTPARALSNNYN